MEHQRFQFETGIDEAVDANMRYWRRAPAARSLRRRSTYGVAAAFTCGVFATLFIVSGAEVDDIPAVAGAALAVGAICWPFYGRMYEGGLRRRLRRLLVEQAGARTSWLCEVELRPEGVWCRDRGVELLIDWRELIGIEDAPDAVELHFGTGFVFVRERAFASPAERATFLQTARHLAAG